MIAKGDSAKEIWATEYGLPSSPYGTTKQATFIQDFLTKWRTISYVGPEYIYTAQDYTGSTFGVWTTNWTAKPAVAVIESFTGVLKTAKTMALAMTVSTDPGGHTVTGFVPMVVNATVDATMAVPKAAVTAGTTAVSSGLGVADAAAHAVSTGLTHMAAGLEQAAATKHAAATVTATTKPGKSKKSKTPTGSTDTTAKTTTK
jgi:hypothetical protein